MNDLLAGMAIVDAEACEAFARRQHQAGYAEDLGHAAAMLHEQSFAAQLSRPDELMRWKYPETFDSVGVERLTQILQAASDQDQARVDQLLVDQPFATLAAFTSIASHLNQAHRQLKRTGLRPADPQHSLF